MTLNEAWEEFLLLIHVDSAAESTNCFSKRGIFHCLFDGPRLLNSCLEIFRQDPMDVVDGMVRMRSGTAVLAIVPNENKLARIFTRNINEADREVLLELLVLTHEDTEIMFSVPGLECHFVPLHFALKLHLSAWRIDDGLRTGDQVGKFLFGNG